MIQISVMPSFFAALVCPYDRLPFEGEPGEFLICGRGHRFPVRAGIPRIVMTEDAYTHAFGEQWNMYRRTQLDSYTGTTITHDRLKRCLGDALWQRLWGPEPVSVLETGCGAGRFSEVLLSLPAVVLTSTDLSSAVDANQANCPGSPRHRVIQCDITALPFEGESHDVVLCLGVIQCTPSPEETIERLYAQVKPGGWLVIDHYSPSLKHYTKVTALLLRPVLKRLSPARGIAATEALTKVFFPIHRMARHSFLVQMIVSRASPLLTYYYTYPQLDDRFQYEWALVDTHDSLTDYYKHFRTPSQIQRALSALGAREIWVAKGGNGVEARCRKPA